jgi:hypothetical protein
MRTTIDMPNDLLQKAKEVGARRKMTFRALVIDALQRSFEEKPVSFRLRDAAAGATPSGDPVSAETINQAIDGQREVVRTH